MTTPRIIASGPNGAVDLSDGLHAEIGYLGPRDLLEPATVGAGATVDTFGGPVRIAAQATHYPPRQIGIDPLYLINGNGIAELYHRAHDLWDIINGRPGRLNVGSLYLPVWWDPPRNKNRVESTKRLELSLSGEALPATWIAQYGYQVGRSQGIYVIDDRLGHAYLKMRDPGADGHVVDFHNPGTAPTSLPLTLSGLTASTPYRIQNSRDGSLVTFSTLAGETAKHLSAAFAVPFYPGWNMYRLLDINGDAAAGTFKWASYIPEFRYLGNEADLFNEGPPVFSLYRSGAASYAKAATGADILDDAVDGAARIGAPIGDYTAAKAGLVLEGESTNLLLRSEEFDHAAWVDVGTPNLLSTAVAAPDGSGTGAERFEDDDGVTNAEGEKQTVTIANDSTWHTASVFFSKLVGAPTYFPELRMALTGGTALTSKVRVNRQSGATEAKAAQGSLRVTVFDIGDWWRVALSMKNNSTGNTSGTLTIYPAIAATIGGAESGTQTGNVEVWGAQWENVPFVTSYIKTTDIAVTRGADYCAAWAPQNRIKYARQLDQNDTAQNETKWYRSGLTVTANNTVATDATQTADRLVITNVADFIRQDYLPEARPDDPKTGRNGWTFGVRLLKGTMVNADELELDINGSIQKTIKGSDLSTTVARSFALVARDTDLAAGASFVIPKLSGKTGTGDPDVEFAWLTRGLFPGRPVMTEGNVVVPDPAHWEWPTWLTQNGYIDFKAVLPRGATEISASKSTNNTKLTIDAISGATVAADYTLRVVRSGAGSPPDWEFTWAGGTPQTFNATAWGSIPFPLTLVGGAGAGSLVVSDGSAGIPPNPNGTYDDTVTVLSGGRPTGLTYPILGDDGYNWAAIYRDSAAATSSNELKIARRNNGADSGGGTAQGLSTVTIANVGAVWDNALHTFRLEWLNYKRSGTQYMFLRLYVDGVLKSTDSNLASATVLSWAEPERLWLSDGKTYATIRDLTIGVPAWTAGDVPEPYLPDIRVA